VRPLIVRLFAVQAALVSAPAAMVACDRHGGGGEGSPAPSASVIQIGVALGTCKDVDVCARECDAGSADRCRRLGATYALGDGVDKDEARGAALYDQACTMGDPSACVFAGQMHEYAHGVPKDESRAASLYERACNAGWSPGCYNLGIMFDRGRGVPQDRDRAAALFDNACTAGSKIACEKAKEARTPPFLVDGGL
jgi:TPR repeat protein